MSIMFKNILTKSQCDLITKEMTNLYENIEEDYYVDNV